MVEWNERASTVPFNRSQLTLKRAAGGHERSPGHQLSWLFGNHSVAWTIGSFAGTLIAHYAADHDVLLTPVNFQQHRGKPMKAKAASFALLGSVVLGVTPAYADAPDVSDQTSVVSEGTSAAGIDAAAGAEGGQFLLATDEQYVQTFGAAKAAQQGLTYEAVTEADPPVDSAVADDTDKAIAEADSAAVADDAGAAADEAASSHWSVVKFVGHDADGRYIPTRQGNRAFGWVHFSGPHNIHSSKVIKVAVSEHPERGSTKTRKLYGAVLYDRLGIILARVKVVAQYHWETADHKYKLADHGDKIGVITAYCQGVNKCPDALNHV